MSWEASTPRITTAYGAFGGGASASASASSSSSSEREVRGLNRVVRRRQARLTHRFSWACVWGWCGGPGTQSTAAAMAAGPRAVDDDGQAPPAAAASTEDATDAAYAEEQRRLDREWYDETAERDAPESYAAPATSNSGTGGAAGTGNKRMSLRQLQYNRDNEAWENNRMLLSGVVQRTSGSVVTETEEEVRYRTPRFTRAVASDIVFVCVCGGGEHRRVCTLSCMICGHLFWTVAWYTRASYRPWCPSATRPPTSPRFAARAPPWSARSESSVNSARSGVDVSLVVPRAPWC
jgi:hypothetical protein